ncbi:hypothetical protein [Clostridium oceanicum]|uniref:Uncharacterized protein n=1 Tax=Clostridium oceanicum TaxID=1543 RepID=A0ABN1JEH9_9CLOT
MKKFVSFSALIIMLLVTFAFSNSKVKASTLTLSKVSTSPEVIEPGNKFKINFSLKNNRESDIEDVTIKLIGLEGKKTLGGFSPVNSSNEIYIGHMDSESTSDASLNMISNPALKTGTYNLQLELEYKRNDKYEKEYRVVGLVLNNKATLLITSLNTSAKNVSVNMVNNSNASLKDVMVTLNANNKTYTKYLGSMDPEDENEYKKDLSLSGNVKGSVTISYKDELNKENNITKDFSIKAPPKDKAPTAKKSSSGFLGKVGSFFKALFGMGD